MNYIVGRQLAALPEGVLRLCGLEERRPSDVRKLLRDDRESLEEDGENRVRGESFHSGLPTQKDK